MLLKLRTRTLGMGMLVVLAMDGCGKTTDSVYKRSPKADESLALTESNGYPYCTNGSNTGRGYGWDTSVTDPTGSHSCRVPPPRGRRGNTSQSSGCQIDSHETGVKNVTIQVGSTQRTYIRVINPNYDHQKKHALVIGFHGAGLDGTSPRRDHKWPLVEAMAGDEAIFLYPNGLGGRWSADGPRGADVRFFDELVRINGEAFCIDPKRVFVHGFSNGSFFVNGLVGLRQNAIRGVISVAGAGAGTRIPAMVIHGMSDPNIGYYPNAQQTVNAYARQNSCTMPVNFGGMNNNSCQLLAGCPADEPVWFCPWDGNHHWPEFTLPDVWRFIASFK
jgi:hypothetical protein